MWNTFDFISSHLTSTIRSIPKKGAATSKTFSVTLFTQFAKNYGDIVDTYGISLDSNGVIVVLKRDKPKDKIDCCESHIGQEGISFETRSNISRDCSFRVFSNKGTQVGR